MSNYKTVRINNESMEKLEEIAETMEVQLKFKISKAAALEHIINEKYETTVATPRKFMLRLVNDSEEKKQMFQEILDEIREQGHEPDFTTDDEGNFIWKR